MPGSHYDRRRNAPLGLRLKIDELHAHLAPIDRYGPTGFGSAIAEGVRALAGVGRALRGGFSAAGEAAPIRGCLISFRALTLRAQLELLDSCVTGRHLRFRSANHHFVGRLRAPYPIAFSVGSSTSRYARVANMPTVTTSDGVEIYYKDWGSGQPIVFSHGWPLSADDWDAQMLFFLDHGYRVIAHDRRGHGRSTQIGRGHDMDHYADDLAAVTNILT